MKFMTRHKIFVLFYGIYILIKKNKLLSMLQQVVTLVFVAYCCYLSRSSVTM